MRTAASQRTRITEFEQKNKDLLTSTQQTIASKDARIEALQLRNKNLSLEKTIAAQKARFDELKRENETMSRRGSNPASGQSSSVTSD